MAETPRGFRKRVRLRLSKLGHRLHSKYHSDSGEESATGDELTKPSLWQNLKHIKHSKRVDVSSNCDSKSVSSTSGSEETFNLDDSVTNSSLSSQSEYESACSDNDGVRKDTRNGCAKSGSSSTSVGSCEVRRSHFRRNAFKNSVVGAMHSVAEFAEDMLDTTPLRIHEEHLKAKIGELEHRFMKKIKERSDRVHKYFQKNTKLCDVNRRLKSQIWSSVVTLVLVEGKNLPVTDTDTGLSDTFVKFRLGNEKYKSRVFWRSTSPRWLEQFDLHLYDDGDQQLEVTVWDKEKSKDDFLGRCVIDLARLEREVTHGFWQELEDGAGSLYFLLTISGTTASETISDLTTHEDNPLEIAAIESRYIWHRTFQNIKDVGHLTVKVFRATGLAAADLGGKSDPFCVIELGNARLQTQTEYKTLAPCWQKIFTFNVKDINSVIEVTVYDEDRDHKVEFLGKLSIPLLRVRNGEKRWYPLKDKKLRSRAKGSNPQILLEMTVLWNPIRACIRTLNPKEEKYMQPEIKFKRQVFVRNVLRLKTIAMHFIDLGKLLQSCFEWESTLRSFIGLVFWLILCYYFEPYMVPAAGLLFFLKQYIVRSLSGPAPIHGEDDDSDLDDEEDDDKDKEEKKSLKERLQAIQEVTQSVQNAIGFIASLGESVKNTFNFTVPYLSWIAVGLLVGACIVLYFIPVRYLLMLWGMNKFARRILRPHSVPNNEVLDLLSRVPDDEMLLDFRELKPLPGIEAERRKEHRKKQKVS